MILWFLSLYCGCLSLVSAVSCDLPAYIQKCSISDPNLNECFREKANLAIPHLAKGDPDFGIPSTSPVAYTSAPVYGNGFKMDLYDTFNDDTKNLNITDFVLDLENGVLELIAVLRESLVTARSYQILNSTVLGIPALGSGKFNLTLVGVTFHFKCSLTEYQESGETYLKITNYTMTSDAERAYLIFGNLLPKKTSALLGQSFPIDMNVYIDQNWKRFYAQLQPVYETYMKTFIYTPFNVIFSKVPKSKLFLP